MKERWLNKIHKHYDNNARYERWEPKERNLPWRLECITNPNSQDCMMCEQVMRDTQKEYNKRVRTTNKLGLRFEKTNRFGVPRTYGKRPRR